MKWFRPSGFIPAGHFREVYRIRKPNKPVAPYFYGLRGGELNPQSFHLEGINS